MFNCFDGKYTFFSYISVCNTLDRRNHHTKILQSVHDHGIEPGNDAHPLDILKNVNLADF